MTRRYFNFLRGISVNWYTKIGVIVTTSSFITFLILELARMAGIFTNQYMGLLTYLVLPALFVMGLLLIPLGWFFYIRKSGQPVSALMKMRFDAQEIAAQQQGSSLFKTILLLSLLNVLFLSGASVQTLHFMDQPSFCGTACHQVMNPEWVVYQDSPHARVHCVECHVGEGIDALISSKLEGARQMLLASFNMYHRPIPTPVKQLRPARETCEKCHWPDKFYGSRLQTSVHYNPDENNTPRYTSLNLKVDTGKGSDRAGIHWHIAAENEIRYASINDQREQMYWVDMKLKDGTYRRFHNKKLTPPENQVQSTRTLDCVDCHNRATHIYEDPARAIDQKLLKGELDRSLPFLKKEGLRAITIQYPSPEAARAGIRNHMEGFYQRLEINEASVNLESLEQAIHVLQQIYSRNVHHHMKISWGTYVSHLGHPVDTTGCFRCHNPQFVADDGSTINHDCTLCHSILADNSKEPFQYLRPISQKDRNYTMQQYLQEEFLNSYHPEMMKSEHPFREIAGTEN